jgi:2,4-didehydro-3-deoxy-L-rhamnonate hydrolase
MKLLRYGPVGMEQPGLLDDKGRIRALSPVIDDLAADSLSPTKLREIGKLSVDKLPIVPGTPRLGTPYRGVGKFVAVGLNYSDHAAESGLAVPAEPVIFFKATSCIVGPNDDIMLPKDSVKTDWEVELGVVIGRTARYVSEQEALDHVAGYCVVNDVSEREYQMERGGQWTKGKSCDTFCPLGPWLVTADEAGDAGKLQLWTEINGKRVQNSNTSDLIFGIDHIVSYVSHFMTLMPGDVIPTGTPSGVAVGMKPPQFLKPGDRMRLSVEGLGEQNSRLVAFPG